MSLLSSEATFRLGAHPFPTRSESTVCRGGGRFGRFGRFGRLSGGHALPATKW